LPKAKTTSTFNKALELIVEPTALVILTE